MQLKKLHVAAVVGLAFVASAAYAVMGNNERVPVEFFPSHSHHNGETTGAPQHSGGTDKNGCHNASVPYHCH